MIVSDPEGFAAHVYAEVLQEVRTNVFKLSGDSVTRFSCLIGRHLVDVVAKSVFILILHRSCPRSAKRGGIDATVTSSHGGNLMKSCSSSYHV